MNSEIEITLKQLSAVSDDCTDCCIAIVDCRDQYKKNVLWEVYKKKCEVRRNYIDNLYELTKKWEKE
jgi:hypothetical protein